MTRNQRIKIALKDAGKTQTDLANALGITQATVNERLNSNKDVDSFELIQKTSLLTGKEMSWLAFGDEIPSDIKFGEQHVRRILKTEEAFRERDEFKIGVAETENQYLSGKSIRPVTVTVDRSGNELLTYVPVKAQAGYRRGYGDPQFLQQLPAFSLAYHHNSKTRTLPHVPNRRKQYASTRWRWS
jgi:transcriptional regulator with XRE-family HTH domain